MVDAVSKQQCCCCELLTGIEMASGAAERHCLAGVCATGGCGKGSGYGGRKCADLQVDGGDVVRVELSNVRVPPAGHALTAAVSFERSVFLGKAVHVTVQQHQHL